VELHAQPTLSLKAVIILAWGEGVFLALNIGFGWVSQKRSTQPTWQVDEILWFPSAFNDGVGN
jgi:hypothetical protein